MAWKCLVPEKSFADERAERKSASVFEKYLLSPNAIYFEGQYLPFALVKSLRAQPSLYYPQCCCGRGIPVTKLRLDYGGEKPLVLMLEKEKNAEKLVSAITAANPTVTVEEYVDPNAADLCK